MSEPDAQDDFVVSSFSIPVLPEALATSEENAKEIMSIR